MSLWLDDEELTNLTGYKLRERRYEALAELKVPFKRRPSDGFPLVERALFEGGPKAARKSRINWEAANV